MSESRSSVDARQIPWRSRADLKSICLQLDGGLAWGIKDPLSLAYFELSDEAYYVLNLLDGRSTIADICASFQSRFGPRTLSSDELGGFLGQLVSQNLVIAESCGHGRAIAQKQQAVQSRQRWAMASNILAIRFRGLDPDRMLERMLHWLGWIFSPMATALGATLIACALLLVALHVDELVARLPEARALVSVPNLVSIGFLLAIVKILHEFGHGLTCKRYGGECHEMGLMLLVFTPTLYCNVSDIWMLKSKWQRMAVSLAGIWVEAIIAAACTLLWWFSAPGLFHSLCLNLIFLCGVNTIIFNGNPLLRYDGYFVLSDWLEVPNLQQQSAAVVRSMICRWFCGFDSGDVTDLSPRRRWGLFFYGAASLTYRWFLTLIILWGLYRWLGPIGLGPLVQIFAVFTVGSMLCIPVLMTASFFGSAGNRANVHWSQLFWRSAVTVTALVILFSVPFPCRVLTEAIADDGDAESVYVTIAGTLVESVQSGQSVEAGQVIARLQDPRLSMTLAQLTGELAQQRLRLEQLERRRVSEPNLAIVLPTVRESVRDLEQQLSQRQRDADRLVVTAPRPGTVLGSSTQRVANRSGSLTGWTGSPLDAPNLGASLRVGTKLCSIGTEGAQSVLILINQDDINLVRVGQRVRFLWTALSGEIVSGEIVELAEFDLDSIPRELIMKLNVPVRAASRGTFRPIGKWYQARVRLEPSDVPLLHGTAGSAKILVDPQSLSSRIVRWLARTFPS